MSHPQNTGLQLTEEFVRHTKKINARVLNDKLKHATKPWYVKQYTMRKLFEMELNDVAYLSIRHSMEQVRQWEGGEID